MKVVLACNFPKDERLGSSRVPLRLAAELGKLGVDVLLMFADDLPHLPNARLEQVTSPVRMARALWPRAVEADIVDIAGFDAWAYAWLARTVRPHQAIVARSNGLWDKALAANGETGRSGMRRAASSAFQRTVLCRFERDSIARADLAVFGARQDADDVVRRGWKARNAVAVVAPGVDDFFESTVPLEARRGIAFVGTFLYRKGSDVLAAAMTRVLRERPTERLALLGPGLPPEQVLSEFGDDVRSRIDLLPSVSARDLARTLGRFAILVFPTRYEGFGLVVLEAMRAGLAIVTTPTGAGADVVRAGENGLVVPFADVDATATAVMRLVDAPAFRARLGGAGLEEARRRGWERTAAELVRAYEKARELVSARTRHS